MLRRGQPSVSVYELAAVPGVKEELQSTRADSRYRALIDGGVLTESLDSVSLDEMVSFAMTGFGAFVLALRARREEQGGVAARAQALAEQAPRFPLAWDVARLLLALAGNPEDFSTLARSTDVQVRELAVEALVELSANDPKQATEVVLGLLRTTASEPGAEEAWRTGLKAAYFIGPAAKGALLWAGLEARPEVRTATTYALYLQWRSDPAFVWRLLQDVAGQVSLLSPLGIRRRMEFLGSMTVTIYVNNCEQQDVAQRTSDLWQEVLKSRLKLDIVMPPAFERLFFAVVARFFSKPIMDAVLFAKMQPRERFFGMATEERERFKRAVALVDPASDLDPSRADLEGLLESNVIQCNILGAMALAIHAYADFASTEPFLRDLFEGLGPPGRLWELLSFTVLLPDADVAAAWTPLLEDFTRRMVSESADLFFGDDPAVPLTRLDLSLLPLGLAYGKVGKPLLVIEDLIREAVEQGDHHRLAKYLAGLGPIGFYRPEPAMAAMRTALPGVVEGESRAAIRRSLASMRILHFDAVDVFLREVGADDRLQREVASSSDVQSVRDYVDLLGLYNNAVHQALHYPKMRRDLLIGGLTALVDARTPNDFVKRYTPVPIRMLREAGWRGMAWTEPD
jgi:hypothetical protein